MTPLFHNNTGTEQFIQNLSDKINRYDTSKVMLELCFTCLFGETETYTRKKDLVNFHTMLCSSPLFCSKAVQVVHFVVKELHPTLSHEENEFLKQTEQQSDPHNILEFKELKFLKVVLELSYENKQDLDDAQLLIQGDNEDVPFAIKQLVSKVLWSNYDPDLLQKLSMSFGRNPRLRRFMPMIDEVKGVQSIMEIFLKG